MVRTEREALLAARREGKYPSRILADAQRVLDVEEAKLQPRPSEH